MLHVDNFVHIMRRYKMEFFSITDPGKVRERNEDAVAICENGTGE